MITDLWIENFKGIGKCQHIPLRPITLLFGRNSAGKSTVLHALLYLREIICNQNIDPAKSLAGSQSVNLGGIDNLRHSGPDCGVTSDVTIGCKIAFSLPGESPPISHENIWEYDFYSYETSYHGYGSELRHCEISSFSDPVAAAFKSYADWYDDSLEWRLNISIGRLAPLDSIGIRYIEIVVDETPLMCRCYGSGIASSFYEWWVNIWHRRLFPNPESADDEPSNASAIDLNQQKKKRLYQKIATTLEDQRLIEIDAQSLMGVGATVSFNLLELPKRPQWFMHGISPEESVNEPIFRQVCTHRLVTLDSFLTSCPSYSPRPIPGVSTGHEGAFVILKQFDGGDDASDNCPVVGVGVRDDSETSIAAVIKSVRLVCLEEALAGPFANEFPATYKRGFDYGDAIEHVGMSLLGPVPKFVDLFDRHRARLDQILRMGTTLLDKRLREFCYVGPKRSTVPRNLNSDVMDEHADWGDGLGAWRWMLKCGDAALKKCSTWLNDEGKGLGTGFALEVERVFEVNDALITSVTEKLGVEGTGSKDEIERLRQELMNSRSVAKITLRETKTGLKRHPQDVGEGITQVIPVIAALVRTSAAGWSEPCLCAIEQPELHLHPSLAAKLGDLAIATMMTEYQPSRALIETHSEHIILRILRRIRQTTNDDLPSTGHIPPVKPDDVCVLWVDNLGDGTTYTRLRISDQGRWLDRWPDGFFRERHQDLFE